MTPAQLEKELQARGLTTQAKAAQALRVDQSTISKWVLGKRAIPGMVDAVLAGIPKLSGTSQKPSSRRAK